MSGAPAVFITGASEGIGAALARAYAARGCRLGLVARRGERLRALAASLRVDCALYEADVRDQPAMARAGADFMARFGVPAVVVANAGVNAGTLARHAEDLEACRWILEVNVVGVLRTFQPFVDPMVARGSGTLAGIASVAGLRGLPGAGAYCASKAALITALESLRVELRGSGVRVSTLLPGYVATAMTARNPYPMPFILDPDEAARRLLRAIDAGRAQAVVPWQMALVAPLLRWLPRPLFDLAFARVGRKPRLGEGAGPPG